jgi:hypothetical protein
MPIKNKLKKASIAPTLFDSVISNNIKIFNPTTTSTPRVQEAVMHARLSMICDEAKPHKATYATYRPSNLYSREAFRPSSLRFSTTLVYKKVNDDIVADNDLENAPVNKAR